MAYLIGVGKQKRINIISPAERETRKLIYSSHFIGTADWVAGSGDECTFETMAGHGIGLNGQSDHVMKITDADGTAAYATKKLGYLAEGRVVWDFWYAHTDITSEQTYLTFYCEFRDGTNRLTLGIRYDVANAIWQYQTDSAGTWSNITGSGESIADDSSIFHHLNIVFDYTNSKIVEFTHDKTTVDCSSLTIATAADVTAANTMRFIIMENSTNNAKPIYVDDMNIWNDSRG
jgi:hypothetical protein